MLETNGKYYLGRLIDPKSNKPTNKPLLYDPNDLSTHAVVVGMTGSGKTGLCIDLLEEAALDNLPAILIDPKGDITNTLLHFPDLLPKDFKPWINPDQAKRDGKTRAQAAADVAATWSKGLKKWGIGKERLTALKNAAHFAVYTPGSDAGIPVSILASFKAPEIDWKKNREVLREKISGTVTAILGLVGTQDIDPVKSREHILLANIFEHAWSQQKDLDMVELVRQVQNPPFEKLGALDLSTFFPDKERFDLAMLLNNILAAPTFQSWIEGQPLDIPSLLYGPDGRPRHSVFYIAHLNEAERMFIVTLLYAAVEAWMRTQTGSTSLRAILYFDEIVGYAPPTANPASKSVIMRMIKQGRAYGLGQVLVTQNPVDIDYKGFSNTGTWIIGKLQTERDKLRLLDGLEGVAGKGMNRKSYSKLISGLGKREFLLHNVHEDGPQVFRTRWAMNYLAGPLTRAQIPALNKLVGAKIASASPTQELVEKGPAAPAAAVIQPVWEDTAGSSGSTTRPKVPSGFPEYFLPNNLSMTEAFKAKSGTRPKNASNKGLLYRPTLLAQADIRFLQRKYNLDHEQIRTALVINPDRRGVVRWEEFPSTHIAADKIEDEPAPNAQFSNLEAPLADIKGLKSLKADFTDWAYRTSEIKVWSNEPLKIYSGPEVTEGEFRKLCSEAASKKRDTEIKKMESGFKKKVAALQKKLVREQRELEEDRDEHSQRRWEELGTLAENIFGGGKYRRRISTSIRKRRMTSKAKADIEESLDEIEVMEDELTDLAEQIEANMAEINDRWGEIAVDISELNITPLKKDVIIDLFGVAWMPYHQVEVDGKTIELPGYASD